MYIVMVFLPVRQLLLLIGVIVGSLLENVVMSCLMKLSIGSILLLGSAYCNISTLYGSCTRHHLCAHSPLLFPKQVAKKPSLNHMGCSTFYQQVSETLTQIQHNESGIFSYHLGAYHVHLICQLKSHCLMMF